MFTDKEILDMISFDYLELFYEFGRLEKTKSVSKRDTSFVYLDMKRIMNNIKSLQMKSNGPVIRGHCNQ